MQVKFPGKMPFQTAFKKFPLLTTKRLELRSLQSADAEAYFAGMATIDSSVWGLRPSSVEATPRFLENGMTAFASKTQIRWGVFKEDQVIGEVRLFGFEYQTKAELSYWITAAERRQGLGAEAVVAVVKFGFEVLELHRIEAVVRPDNEGSLALATKIGFQREGLLRKARNEGGRNGIWNDAVVLGMLREEFV